MVGLDELTVRSGPVGRRVNKTNEALFDRCSVDDWESGQRAVNNGNDGGSDRTVSSRKATSVLYAMNALPLRLRSFRSTQFLACPRGGDPWGPGTAHCDTHGPEKPWKGQARGSQRGYFLDLGRDGSPSGPVCFPRAYRTWIRQGSTLSDAMPPSARNNEHVTLRLRIVRPESYARSVNLSPSRGGAETAQGGIKYGSGNRFVVVIWRAGSGVAGWARKEMRARCTRMRPSSLPGFLWPRSCRPTGPKRQECRSCRRAARRVGPGDGVMVAYRVGYLWARWRGVSAMASCRYTRFVSFPTGPAMEGDGEAQGASSVALRCPE